jgi:hypothetical protein
MPDLTETGVEFTDFANSLTTGQLKITYPSAPRDAENHILPRARRNVPESKE